MQFGGSSAPTSSLGKAPNQRFDTWTSMGIVNPTSASTPAPAPDPLPMPAMPAMPMPPAMPAGAMLPAPTATGTPDASATAAAAPAENPMAGIAGPAGGGAGWQQLTGGDGLNPRLGTRLQRESMNALAQTGGGAY